MMEACTKDVRESLASEMQRLMEKYPAYSLDEMYAEYRDALDSLRKHMWEQMLPEIKAWLLKGNANEG